MQGQITDMITRMFKGDTIPEAERKAFRTAEAEKPGSCHLEVPEDIADETAHTTPIPQIAGPEQARPTTRQIQQASQLINKSKTPRTLTGNAIIASRSTAPLRQCVAE